MEHLDPIGFNIETSGLGETAPITVAGFLHGIDESIILNVDGRPTCDRQSVISTLDEQSTGIVQLDVIKSE